MCIRDSPLITQKRKGCRLKDMDKNTEKILMKLPDEVKSRLLRLPERFISEMCIRDSSKTKRNPVILPIFMEV